MKTLQALGLVLVAIGLMSLASNRGHRIGTTVAPHEVSQLFGATGCLKDLDDTFTICTDSCGGRNTEHFTDDDPNGQCPDFDKPKKCGTGSCMQSYLFTYNGNCGGA